MKRLFAMLLLGSLLACGGPASPPPTGGSSIRRAGTVAIAYALGGKGDQNYNDAAGLALQPLKAAGYEVLEYEPSSMDDYSKGLEFLALRQATVLFCVGFLYDEPVKRLATRHPGITFVVLDGSVDGVSNALAIKFNSREGSELAGAVAGALSKSKRIAFVGGADLPIIREFLEGYQAGARFVAPDITVFTRFVGVGGTAFTDPVKGRQVALDAIREGADVIYHAAGTTGNGVIKAAQEAKIVAIGVDVDQTHLAPDVVATSMLKRFDVAIQLTLKGLQDRTLTPGSSNTFGLREGAVDLGPVSPRFDAQIRAAVAAARARILDSR